MKTVSRSLLVISAALLLLSSIMHAHAFPGVQSVLAASDVAVFFRQALEALWLIEAVTLLLLAIIFAVVATRPAMASRGLVTLLAVVPASSAVLLYRFMGFSFMPAHVLLLAAVLAFVSGLLRIT